MKDHDDSNEEFPMEEMWPKGLSGMELASINFPAFINTTSSRGEGGENQIKMINQRSSGKGKHMDEPNSTMGDHSWTVESLSNYVQTEFSDITLRLRNLEENVNQIISARQVSDQQSLLPRYSLRKEISRGHLDRYCLPLLETTPQPSLAAFTRISQQLENIYEQLDRKRIISQIRKWFRKRREEMAARISSSIRRHFSDLLQDEASVANFATKVTNQEIDLTTIISDSRLEIVNEEAVKVFTTRKILSFLARYRPLE